MVVHSTGLALAGFLLRSFCEAVSLASRRGPCLSGITASNRVYDGTVLAKLNTNNVTLSGNLDGTNVLLKLVGVIGNFLTDGSIGTNKTVQISGLTLSGSATNNYLLIQPTTTANIAAFKVALSFSGNPTTLTSIGNPGVSYITQRSTNLVNWVNISTNVATSSGVISISDSFNDLGGHQPPWAFYRLKL